mmetsp:Transcript_78892/g.203205  ORF Transcript_78892/g.203205 Transcript_78892/m.203205 type:complete len:283 (-) Transcript_78892:472-1320(-)
MCPLVTLPGWPRCYQPPLTSLELVIIRHLPHDAVVEALAVLHSRQELHDHRRGEASDHRDAQCGDHAEGLRVGVQHQDADEAGEQAGHAVQVVHAARVAQAEQLAQVKPRVADRGHKAGDETQAHGARRANVQVRRHAHRYTRRQRRVLHLHDVELAAVEQARHDGEAHGGTHKTDEGVRHGVEHGRAGRGHSPAEGGPQDPQEEAARQREKVRRVDAGVVLVAQAGGARENEGHGKAEVGAEGMQSDAARRIVRTDLVHVDHKGDPVDDGLAETHHDELRG